MYDENDRLTGNYGWVEEDSVWLVEAKGELVVRLKLVDGDSAFGYIDITRQHLEDFFIRQ